VMVSSLEVFEVLMVRANRILNPQHDTNTSTTTINGGEERNPLPEVPHASHQVLSHGSGV
jgi:hypothetical protein